MKISEFLQGVSEVKCGEVFSYDLVGTVFSEKYKLAKELCAKGYFLDDTWNLPRFNVFKFKDISFGKKVVVERVSKIKTKVLYKQLAIKSLDNITF